MAEESRQDAVRAPGKPVELAAARESGESRTQPAYGVTVEVPFTAEAGPLAEDNQGDHLTARQGRLGAGRVPGRELGLAKIISQNVECREEGVRIHHSQPLS